MTAAQRITRLERALAETLYMVHGTPGMPTLRRQAPNAAAIVQEWLDGTMPVDDTFVGRVEKPEDRR